MNQIKLILKLLAIFILWLLMYNLISPLANWITFTILKLNPNSHFGISIAFFLYDTAKILLLLTGMIFLISIVQTFFNPEIIRAVLGGKREGIGNVLAALLGIVTPFCSCSAVPLFMGFIQSGIPLGITFSFLIAAPTINEIAIVLLFGLFGWQITLLYITSGLMVAIISGIIIGRLNMERYVEDFTPKVKVGKRMIAIKVDNPVALTTMTWEHRIQHAWNTVIKIVNSIWLYVVIGIAVGAIIHGYVPNNALAIILGAKTWWSVPLAVLIGIPLYSNAASIIPIVSSLIEKGASIGTALAFMMSVIGLSLPEAIILKRVLKLPLLITFFTIVAISITITGCIFNAIL
jgi:hypothetical protein